MDHDRGWRSPGKRSGVGLWAVVLLSVVLAGCGKEGPPLPPEIQKAQRTTDLSAYQESDEAVLRWSYPKMTTAGKELPEIDAIEIWRATLPLGQEPPPALSAQDRAMRRQLLSAEGEVITILDPDGVAAATRGPNLTYRDDLEAWRSQTAVSQESSVVWYSVRTVCCRKRESEFSNIVRLEPRSPPSPPTELQLEAGAGGIRASWQQGEGLETIVERSPDGALWSEVVEEPIEDQEWLDTDAVQGRAWSYRLRSVERFEGGVQVIGQPSSVARVDHPDTYPPSAPAEIVCLPEGQRVRVRWQAVSGAETYAVRRSQDNNDAVLLAAKVAGVELTDSEPPLGELTYLVVAIDASGNRSPEASCTVTMGAMP